MIAGGRGRSTLLPPGDVGDEGLGERVYRLRHEHALTLHALARAVGVSPVALSDVEHGRARPSGAVLDKLASTLGVSQASLASCSTVSIRNERLASRLVDLVRGLR